MVKQLTKWQRIEAAIHYEPVDRVPINLWKHYHLQDRAPRQLAEATVAFYRQFDLDLITLTPNNLYSVQDWGATIQYGRDDNTLPILTQPVITSAEQWVTLPRLDVTKGALGRELEFIHHVDTQLKDTVPFMMTLFSPLTVAYKLCSDRVSGDALFGYLRESPRQLHAGLKIIRDVIIEYAETSLRAGASGIFFATPLASYDKLSPAEYEEFGKSYDLEVLGSLVGRSRVTVLHLCRENLMFDLTADYPVDAINWADRSAGPSLTEARRLTKAALAGGLSLETLLNGSPEAVQAEVYDAVAQAGRIGFILASACVVKGSTPDVNLAAACQAVAEIS